MEKSGVKKMVGALEGIRVLDLTRLLPGPYCSMLLADLGAEVLKIEEPSQGDTMRLREPFLIKESMQYLILNRNKRSLTLNLKAPKAGEIFRRLAAQNDVILESFRPGVAQRLGIDYESIKKVNPGIIYCSITGYGQDGPYRDIPGHDINYLGISGILSMTGQKDGPPIVPGLPVADVGGGLFAGFAILAAIIARGRTGRGQYIDMSMLDGLVSFLTIYAANYFGTGRPPLRGTFRQSCIYPFYNVYETEDRKYLTLGCSERHLWANLCNALGREDLIEHQFDEGEKREETFQFLRKTFKTRPRDEWIEILRKANVCIAPVYDLGEVFSDLHILSRQMVREVEHPVEGPIKQLGFPWKFSETPGRIKMPPPSLGEHTGMVLQDLGYGCAEVETLRKEGVI
jgi:crotonobetainyl-CoA:carnitine CoA-transferase CaiB-like acyl-CoA transferase